jgi:plasmid maintenance system antidote protein VapI
MSTTTNEANLATDVQGQARQLLRRLMADRNLRTDGVSQLIGVEPHTLRRMLNGSRAISLDEMVLIAQLGDYSLDQQFKLGGGGSVQNSAQIADVNGGLGKVFGAIAELLSAAPVGAHNFETRDQLLRQRRTEPAPREMVAQLSSGAQESLARIIAGEGQSQKRTRTRTVA